MARRPGGWERAQGRRQICRPADVAVRGRRGEGGLPGHRQSGQIEALLSLTMRLREHDRNKAFAVRSLGSCKGCRCRVRTCGRRSQSHGYAEDGLHRSKCRVAKEALGTHVSPEEGCRSVVEGQTGKCGQHNPEPLRSSAVRVKKRGVVTWPNLPC